MEQSNKACAGLDGEVGVRAGQAVGVAETAGGGGNNLTDGGTDEAAGNAERVGGLRKGARADT